MSKKAWLVIAIIVTAVIIINSCSKGIEVLPANNFGFLPGNTIYPPANPYAANKAAFGKLLFFDPILSGNKDVACASCHHPAFGYTDNRDIAIGVNGVGLGVGRRFADPNDIPFTKRNTPTILNAAFNGIDPYGNYDPAKAPMFFDNGTLP